MDSRSSTRRPDRPTASEVRARGPDFAGSRGTASTDFFRHLSRIRARDRSTAAVEQPRRIARWPRADQLAMIDLDVRALTDLSLAFIDSLKRRRGGILNVASIAAFMPGPGMAIYYASKAYVLSFSEALHQELKPKGVRVTVLCPGPVPTEFQARAGLGADALPRILTRSAEQVARDAYRGLKQGRRVVVPGFANSVMTTLTRFAPRGLLLDLIDRQQRGRR